MGRRTNVRSNSNSYLECTEHSDENDETPLGWFCSVNLTICMGYIGYYVPRQNLEHDSVDTDSRSAGRGDVGSQYIRRWMRPSGSGQGCCIGF